MKIPNTYSHKDFYIEKKISRRNIESDFLLHHHNGIEIFIYMSGNADFIVGSSIYKLTPLDILVIPSYTLHQPRPHINTTFERYVINVFPTFCAEMDCQSIYNILNNNDISRLKISQAVTRKHNILSIINDMYKYTDGFTNLDQPIAYYKLYELLYVLATLNSFDGPNNKRSLLVTDIIKYIDENFSTIDNIEDIAIKFNYSKSHISSLFKHNTSLTLPQYIKMKRFENVKKLSAEGFSLQKAAILSGFNNYNNFAYAYKKAFGHPPTIDLK